MAVLFSALIAACGSTADVGIDSEPTAVVDELDNSPLADGSSAVDESTVSAVDEVVVADEQVVESSGASDGDLVLLSAEEIGHGLLGNTIIGNWLGEDYRQFFDESGFTTYRPVESGQDSVGKWRINGGTDLYESLWNDSDLWDGYEVHSDGDTWFWSGQGVQLSPFTIVEGNQLAGP